LGVCEGQNEFKTKKKRISKEYANLMGENMKRLEKAS